MIHISELEQYSSFFVETTVGDKFEIVPKENGFLFRDINPPLLEKDIQDIKSVKMPEYLVKQAQHGAYLDQSKILFYDGIQKGFSFVFYDNAGMVITNGKITDLYVEQQIGQFQFNVHLLEQAGRKVALYELAEQGLVIETDMSEYVITSDGENQYFDGDEIVGIYSLFRMKANAPVVQLDSLHLAHEYDVHPQYLYLNKPFILLRKKSDTKLTVSVIGENVRKVRAL